MRSHNWAESPLGPPATWPQSLRAIVRLVLDSKAPQFVAWGPQLCLLYNDAYLVILREKGARALGRPLKEIWSDIWPDIESLVKRTLAGESLRFEDTEFTLHRADRDEAAWFSFTYTPIRDEDGTIQGFHCGLVETTNRVLLERERNRQTERLYSLFEQTPSFMAITAGPNHVYELANPAYLQFVGQRELAGKSVKEVFPELASQGYLEILDKVYQTGQPFIGRRMEVQLQRQPHAQLDTIFIDFVFQPMRDEHGAVSGIFIEGYDVTEHQRTEERSRLNEQAARDAARLASTEQGRLNALLDAAPVGISFADQSGRIILANAENRRLWGDYPQSESVDEYGEWKGWWADQSERHGQRVQPNEWAIARALRGEEVLGDVVDIEPFGMPGSRRTILLRACPVRNSHDDIVSAVVAQMDISEQVRSEAALRESEAKFRTIADAMPQMVWSTRPDGYHDYYNQRWYDFTGMPVGSTDGASWNDMFHADDQARAWKLWRNSLETGEPYEIEYRLRHRSGEYRWVLGRALPVRDESGRIIRWMGTCTDIHEHKLNQEALKESDRRKDEFLAMLAHELRNPLAPISAAAELLAMLPSVDDRTRQISEVIARHAHHMTELVNDLLDVSRVTRGLAKLEKEPVDIQAVVTEAVEQIRPLAEERGHALNMHFPLEKAMVLGDKKRLVQVLANLLGNAAKYTPNGGRVDLNLEADPHRVTICVRDNGIGMTPDLVRSAFELFSQGERTADRAQGGLGIGLALVKSLVELHGGTVGASSQGVGLGSTFTVTLPRISVKKAAGTVEGNRPASIRANWPCRVLLVDDNIDAADMLGMFLTSAGFETTVEYYPTNALNRARDFQPHVCLLDIGLPEIDGYQLARQLRSLPATARTHLVAVSGYGQSQDIDAVNYAVFEHHLVKPVNTVELVRLLNEIVANEGGQAQLTEKDD
ncbi:hybrid sensor histidine kinase/response regulator [Noviherbaspirillum aridicola]|nr:PAS domain-containing protein [Noviherbaspirillum aridicola]